MKTLLLAACLASLSTAAAAHEIWIERDGAGPVRIYLGEPAEVPPPGGDPEFAKLIAPTILGTPSPKLVRKAGWLETAVPAGDVRVWDDHVFTPWGEEGKKETVVYYARAGRADASTRLPFEIAPAQAGADRFVLWRDGKRLPATEVTLITPTRQQVKLTTDAAGTVLVPADETGRYLLTAAVKDGPATIAGNPVAVVHRITTTTFTRP